MQSKPFKSSRHAALALEDHASIREATARDIARVFGRPSVPYTRRDLTAQTPLWRVLRALWRWL